MSLEAFYWSLIAFGFVVELVGGWGVYDVMKFPEQAWAAAGRDRVRWIIYFVVFGPFALPFYVSARAAAKKATAELPPPPAWGYQAPPPVSRV